MSKYKRVAPSEAKIVGSRTKTAEDVVCDVRGRLQNALDSFKSGKKIGRLIVRRDIGEDRNVICLRVGIASRTTGFVPLPSVKEEQAQVIQEVIDDLDSWSEDLFVTWKDIQQAMIKSRKKALLDAEVKEVA